MQSRLLVWLCAALLGLTSAAQATEAFAPHEHWYGVYIREAKVGHARMGQQLSTWEGRDVIEVYASTEVQIALLGTTHHITITEHEYTDPDTLEFLGLAQFTDTSVPGMAQSIRAFREGSEIVVQTLAGTEVTATERQPFDPASISSGYALTREIKASIDPATGGEFRSTIFSPVTLQPALMVMVFEPVAPLFFNGIEEQAFKIVTEIGATGLSATEYQTAEGILLKTTMLDGMIELRLEDEALAKSGAAVPDLLAQSRVAVTGQSLPQQPIAQLEVRPVITGTLPSSDFPTTHRQRMGGTSDSPTLIIDMPGPGQGPPAVLDLEERAYALGDSLYVQPSHPRIASKAQEIVAGIPETDARARSFAIVDWVYTNVSKELVPTSPNAVQVLDMMKGDCGEHAVLTAALARAAGLPTKVLYGLVYTPTYGRGFFYHAWNAVLVEDRWLEVDSALGMFPADATHIVLGEGDDPGSAVVVMGLYGRLSFEVLRALPGEFTSEYLLDGAHWAHQSTS